MSSTNAVEKETIGMKRLGLALIVVVALFGATASTIFAGGTLLDQDMHGWTTLNASRS